MHIYVDLSGVFGSISSEEMWIFHVFMYLKHLFHELFPLINVFPLISRFCFETVIKESPLRRYMLFFSFLLLVPGLHLADISSEILSGSQM